MDPQDLRKWARMLSMIGGIVMVAGSLLFALMGVFMTTFLSMFGDVGMMFGTAFGAMLLIFALFGASIGGLAIYASSRLEGPDPRTWSIVLLVCGIVGFFTGTGLGVGSILVAVGGGIALANSD